MILGCSGNCKLSFDTDIIQGNFSYNEKLSGSVGIGASVAGASNLKWMGVSVLQLVGIISIRWRKEEKTCSPCRRYFHICDNLWSWHSFLRSNVVSTHLRCLSSSGLLYTKISLRDFTLLQSCMMMLFTDDSSRLLAHTSSRPRRWEQSGESRHWSHLSPGPTWCRTVGTLGPWPVCRLASLQA